MSEFATRMVLEQSNMACTIKAFDTAKEGLTALEKLSKNGESPPDYILLDLKMPEMNGWEFLDILQSIGIYEKRTKIYMVSNYANAKVRQRAVDHKLIKGYLERPLSTFDVEKIFSTDIN